MRSLFRVLGCFGIPLLGAAAVVILLESGKPTEPFTPERWGALAPGDRERVVDDLLERRLLIGLREEEVRDLLGEPSEGKWRDEDLSYRIGTEFGRVELLMITFDGEKVDSAWTWYPPTGPDPPHLPARNSLARTGSGRSGSASAITSRSRS